MADLLERLALPGDVRAALSRIGDVFADFGDDESGCIAHGVEIGGARYFVKHPVSPRGLATQERAIAIHAAVKHPTLVPLLHRLDGDRGPALVYPWIDGVRLRGSYLMTALETKKVLDAIEAVIEVHVAMERAGFFSIDLYDGNLLYGDRIHLIDVDEYRLAPYVRLDDRFLGSKRFMAPEEWIAGATLDSRTMVFQLGRLAAVLLDPPQGASLARAQYLRPLVARATDPQPSRRFQTAAELFMAWHAVRPQAETPIS
jgi:serine/threonine-protein kinase